MINERQAKRYCENYKLIENYDKAVADENQMWECHHKKEVELMLTRKQMMELGIYFHLEPSELIFLTRSDHKKLHESTPLGKSAKRRGADKHIGTKHTDETKQKMSIASKGKKKSDETRKRMSESLKGNKRCLGRRWYNNGVESKTFKDGEQPQGWVLGRLPFKK